MAAGVRVLVILGHPRNGSLCEALADSYAAGAVEAGAEVRRLDVAEMQFDLNVTGPSPRDQTAEPSVKAAMELVAWAEHLVFVFPTWWGTMPALLKGFLDRVLMPGFAFADRDDGEGWDKLLTGKSAHLLTTMDTPAWVYRWIYRAPGLNAIALATLGFCGIGPVRRSIFGPVKEAAPERRARWLELARREGLKLRDGILSKGERLRHRILAWVRAMRLQFHPMVWGTYGIGAAAAQRATHSFAADQFWLGLLSLFALEVATVFTNEYFDLESDRRNRHYGPFTGGSRVLVDGTTTLREIHLAIAMALGVFLSAMLAVSLAFVRPAPLIIILVVLAIFALGYTVPPLKLCWRSLGEVDVALTHSLPVILYGYTMQGGAWTDAFPWLVGVPLFWAVLPAIILSGIPDHAADLAVGKRSLAVRLGPRAAVRIAQGATLLALLAAFVLQANPIVGAALSGLSLMAMPHAALQVVLLERYLRRRRPPGRIDALMALSLLYIVWFFALPLWRLIVNPG